MRSKADFGDNLNNIIHEYGIPEFGIHTNNAGEESGDTSDSTYDHPHLLLPTGPATLVSFESPPFSQLSELHVSSWKGHDVLRLILGWASLKSTERTE
jgi:hypothetical protein